MARIKIHFPDHYAFKTLVKLRVTDINYGGHLGNDNVLSLIHEARLQFFRHLGFKSEIDISENVGIIVADAAIQYKAESFYGDELEIKVAVNDFNKYGFDLVYQLTNVKTDQEVATGKTGVVCFDYKAKKVVPNPENLLKLIKT